MQPSWKHANDIQTFSIQWLGMEPNISVTLANPYVVQVSSDTAIGQGLPKYIRSFRCKLVAVDERSLHICLCEIMKNFILVVQSCCDVFIRERFDSAALEVRTVHLVHHQMSTSFFLFVHYK